MESATTGAEGSSTVITRKPFFKVVSLKSTRTLRGPCAWAERAASAQTNRGKKTLETRLMCKTPLDVDVYRSKVFGLLPRNLTVCAGAYSVKRTERAGSEFKL